MNTTVPARPFRVLWIDDECQTTSMSKKTTGTNIRMTSEQALFDWLFHLTPKPLNFEVWVDTTGGLFEADGALKRHAKPPVGDPEPPKLHNTYPGTIPSEVAPCSLSEFDVVILDIGGVERIEDLTLPTVLSNFTKAGKANPSEHEFKSAPLGGISFYHHHFKPLGNCTAVYVLTKSDPVGGHAKKDKTLEGPITNFLVPFCVAPTPLDKPVGNTNRIPVTFMETKSEEGLRRLASRLRTFYGIHQVNRTWPENLHDIEYASMHSDPVLLVGENGTGKEGVARAIHERWIDEDGALLASMEMRPTRPFVTLNVMALSPRIAEADDFMFGAKGVVKLAAKGTLFIDAIGELPSKLQAKLVQLLDDNAGSTTNADSFRLITASDDPRIASFVGFHQEKDRLVGQERGDAASQGLIRPDTLSRIKGQAIRVTPVTETNVAQVIERTIRSLPSNEAKLWTDRPKNTLIKQFKGLIQETSKPTSQDGYRLFFGHRREIRSTIRRITQVAKHSQAIGIREGIGVISAEAVERDFRPGKLMGPAIQTSTHIEYSTAASIFDSGLIKRDSREGKILQFLCNNPNTEFTTQQIALGLYPVTTAGNVATGLSELKKTLESVKANLGFSFAPQGKGKYKVTFQ